MEWGGDGPIGREEHVKIMIVYWAYIYLWGLKLNKFKFEICWEIFQITWEDIFKDNTNSKAEFKS